MPFYVLAQNTKQSMDKRVSEFVTVLQDKKVKQIGYTTYYCLGSKKTAEFKQNVCDYESVYYETYLFWMEGSKNFVKKFDNCSEFNEVEIKSNQFFSYFVFNREKIKNEEVKRFQATEIIGKDTLLLTVSTDHACHAKLTIFEGNRRIDKVIDYHNLSAATTGDKNKSEININYTYNNALKLVEWDKKIKEIVTDLGKKKSFARK
ncbi:MAG: hypothetical protein IT236_10950 [Bacteroidia bacterium]|nr:hypothetical protein [Bacteroidia bacterium]